MGSGKMREFLDKETGLRWVVPEITGIVSNNPEYIPEDEKGLDEFRKELNQYNSTSISTYVTGGYCKLGDFMIWANMGNSFPCYAFDDGKMVASAIIKPNNALGQMTALKDYIRFCEDNPVEFEDGIKGYISLKKAKKILLNSGKDTNADISYLVVIPPAQGRGVGTRAVKSISNNLDFFASGKTCDTICTEIHKKNTPSQKVFKKNGFEEYSLARELAYDPFGEYIKTI